MHRKVREVRMLLNKSQQIYHMRAEAARKWYKDLKDMSQKYFNREPSEGGRPKGFNCGNFGHFKRTLETFRQVIIEQRFDTSTPEL